MQLVLNFIRLIAVVSGLIAFQAEALGSESTTDRRDAQGWLRTMQSSAHSLSYAGTFVYQQGSQVRTSRITHVADGHNEFEKLEILDGKPREYIRNNDEVVFYVPESRTLLVEKRVTQDIFPAILAAGPAEIAANYGLHKGETGRIAGFDCQSVVLEPKDRFRYGYKFWAEKGSGLLLRAQTLNDSNEVVEQIAFTQISIGGIDRARVKPSYPQTQGWRVENSVMSTVAPSGWAVKNLPGGFRKISEVRRMVSDTPAASSGGATQASRREVTQIVYSDGLAAISVFVEPGTQSKTEGSMQQGALNIIGRRQGDFWLTIVGEVPLAAIRQVANSIEFKSR